MKREISDFDALIKSYGSWVRVIVAFYDFLFVTALKMCPKHTTEAFLHGFAEGKDPYEDAIGAIEKRFENFADAWVAFVKEEKETRK